MPIFKPWSGLVTAGLLGLVAVSCGGLLDRGGGTGGGQGGSVGTAARAGAGGAKGGSAGVMGGAAGSAFDACAQPSDCAVVDATCCGSCEPTLADLVAINQSKLGDYLSQRPCTDVLCPACNSSAPSSRVWFGATCDQGHCVVFDARENLVTACNVSDDCVLRAGLGCCEGCGGTGSGVVAVNKGADLESLVCGAPIPCPACSPVFPSDYQPACVTGHCQTMLPKR
jgi:hypothetical protein